MSSRAAITVHRPPDEVRRLWSSPEHRPQYIEGLDAAVMVKDAPGDRGTEIHVELSSDGGLVSKFAGDPRLPKVKDALRRFKQHVETGEIPRSEATLEGERVESKFKQRPAQPPAESELQKAGVR